MKKVFNSEIILDALVKYTGKPFEYDEITRVWESKDYALVETDWYIFEVYALVYDRDTGFMSDILLESDLSLADAIDKINADIAQKVGL